MARADEKTFGATCEICGVARHVVMIGGWRFRACSVCDLISPKKARKPA